MLFSDSILAWQADPMVINLAETGLPVRNLDFPAVTGRIFLIKLTLNQENLLGPGAGMVFCYQNCSDLL